MRAAVKIRYQELNSFFGLIVCYPGFVVFFQVGYSPSFGPGPKQRASLVVSGGGFGGISSNSGFRGINPDSLGSSVNSVASNLAVNAVTTGGGGSGSNNNGIGNSNGGDKKADLMRELFGKEHH